MRFAGVKELKYKTMDILKESDLSSKKWALQGLLSNHFKRRCHSHHHTTSLKGIQK